MRQLATVCAVFVCVSHASVSASPVVYFRLANTQPFKIWAWTSEEGSGGLASFSITLSGVESVRNTSPFLEFNLNFFGPQGFVVDRSDNDEIPIRGAQDLTRPSLLVYGLGQRPVDFMDPRQPPESFWDMPIPIAEGHIPVAEALRITQASAELFESDGSLNTISVPIEWQISILRGDFDEDGDVDGFDLGIWQAGFGTPFRARRTDGDANFDGFVDAFDLGVWQQKFGLNLIQYDQHAPLPEPGTLGVLAGALCLGRGRRVGPVGP